VRPNPVITSSAISNTPWRSQISAIRGQYSLTGVTAAPDEPIIGSAMNAAIESGPWRSISCSSAVAQSIPHPGYVLPQAHR
jgi:hypothetical protein